jgi:hypothetical protein
MVYQVGLKKLLNWPAWKYKGGELINGDNLLRKRCGSEVT